MSVKKLLIKDLLRQLNIKSFYLQQINKSYIVIINFKGTNNAFEVKKIENNLKLWNIDYRVINKDNKSISLDIL